MEIDYVGRRLKRYRQLRGLKAVDLAKRSGVPQSTISDVERGLRSGVNLTVKSAEQLCWALGISLDTLCRKERDEESIEAEYMAAAEA
jgi:transcriptional regulator with XRE-family HTH domain